MCKTHENRICEHPGCDKLGKNVGKNKDGTVRREKLCPKHRGIVNGCGGWDYKIYRKEYCENIDGRLGFTCTTPIILMVIRLAIAHLEQLQFKHYVNVVML